ncbi:DASH complex protein [Malassezia pachydermatis]
MLNEALMEMNRSIANINNHNQEITIVAEMWNGYHRNVEFNLQNIQSTDANTHPNKSASA